MDANGFSVKELLAMAHSPVKNYAVPGLTSSLIGNPSPAGTMRLFQCDREHQEPITPHSHRFDFQCWVLAGRVRNRIWKRSEFGGAGDLFMSTYLKYEGEIGAYTKKSGSVDRWSYEDAFHQTGQCYGMTSDEVHSIYFSRGAIVLFFEGATKENTSLVIEPWVDNEVVPTFKVEPWMFKRN